MQRSYLRNIYKTLRQYRTFFELTLLAALFITVSIIAYFGYHLRQLATQPFLNQSELVLEIPKHINATKFVNLLYDKQLIKQPKLLLIFIKTQRLAKSLQAGIYQVYKNESPTHFLYRVVNGDILKGTITIIDGTTKNDVSHILSQTPYLNYEPHVWSLVEGGNGHQEGMLLADTYEYIAGSNASTIITKANRSLLSALKKTWNERDKTIPYRTPYELLIAASIIDKEAKLMDEKKLVSSVLVNRLIKHMPLQMDPTVIYGLGDKFIGRLSKKDLKTDTPYNTYVHYGLPPTPISMVGLNELTAAAHPANTNYLYYVAKGDGTHIFSETYREQINAVNTYQKVNHGK